MNSYVYFDRLSARVRCLYFSRGAAAIGLWIKSFGRNHLPKELCQVLAEYDCEEFSVNSINIDIIGDNKLTFRVVYNGHLLIWRIKKCN